jgi:hypothetical protein
MREAITTRFLRSIDFGRTWHIKASCADAELTVQGDDRWTHEQNHIHAAMQLARKLGSELKFRGGYDASGNYVFLPDGDETYFTKDYEPRLTVDQNKED